MSHHPSAPELNQTENTQKHRKTHSPKPPTAKTRLEVRISPQDKDLIEQAAQVTRETTTTFVLHAARAAAQDILRREQVTVVPPDFFEAILASLEAPPQRNDALAAAARENSDIMKR